MSHETLMILVSVLTTFVASSGFWTYVNSRSTKKSATVRLIMGLAHDKAASLGLEYIRRGYVTRDELEDFQKYLYNPYKELGGNGVIERIMNEVLTLPLVEAGYKTETVVL